MSENFMSKAEIQTALGISRTTLALLISEHGNELQQIATPGGQRRYLLSEVKRIMVQAAGGDQDAGGDSAGGDQDAGVDSAGGDQDAGGDSGPIVGTQYIPAIKRFEWHVYTEQGKKIDAWTHEPTETDVFDGYGPGNYRVFKVDMATGLKDNCVKYLLKNEQAPADSAGGSDTTKIFMDAFKLALNLVPKQSNETNLIMELLKSEREEKRFYQQQATQSGGKSGMSSAKEFLDIIDFAKESGFLGGGDADGEAAATPAERIMNQITETIKELLPSIVAGIQGGGAVPVSPGGEPMDLTKQLPPVPDVQITRPGVQQAPPAAGDDIKEVKI